MLSDYTLSFFFQAEDGIRDYKVTGVQTCALPILVNMYLDTAIIVKLLVREPDSDWFNTALLGQHFETSELALAEVRSALRSEERRVGKECRSRWSPYH